MELSAEDKLQIIEDLNRIEQILNTDIFEERNHRHPLVRSAFIDLIICLDDLMSKVQYYCKRIDFTDDLLVTTELQERSKKRVKDVTDLINFVRHAVCHINEDNRIHRGRTKGPNKERKGAGIFFNRQFGKRGLFKEMQSKYEDDQTFAFGEHLIYLKRHIIRAFQEAKELLLENYPMIDPTRTILGSIHQALKHNPKMIEKVYEIRVKVEDSPYQQAIDKGE
ncbi:hypothetical protein [Shewanella nanhaiensis]|uniref:Cthe-2314-like HEPN domain-containing protein n=1 Tax=Shewanella nanhaiensis TaxID=2864872 RepID=A0ABS7E613_9GAMM|nr:hypothetical protein [Shewanella nanhaiensis]MBW8185117.1 hypothetical protein [Shewanella nanhaiensis]